SPGSVASHTQTPDVAESAAIRSTVPKASGTSNEPSETAPDSRDGSVLDGVVVSEPRAEASVAAVDPQAPSVPSITAAIRTQNHFALPATGFTIASPASVGSQLTRFSPIAFDKISAPRPFTCRSP